MKSLQEMGKFDLIVVDPPWPVSKIKRRVRPNQVKMDYPTMSLDEIKNLPVAEIAEPESWCFLWTTHRFLPDAFRVLEQWGFHYQRTLTWDKGNGLCLFGFHHRTEFVLVGRKGPTNIYASGKAIPTIFSGRSRRHSAKPDEFYQMVAHLGTQHIDVFARIPREGWTVWGNEVDTL